MRNRLKVYFKRYNRLMQGKMHLLRFQGLERISTILRFLVMSMDDQFISLLKRKFNSCKGPQIHLPKIANLSLGFMEATNQFTCICSQIMVKTNKLNICTKMS